MAPKKKKGSVVKKVLIIGGSLIVVQIGLILYFQQKTSPRNVREEIARKVETTPGISSQRRELLKVQLAINDFRLKSGTLPASLESLVPDYFDSVPLDPETNQPFKYALDNGRFILGEKQLLAAASTTARGVGEAQTQDKDIDEQLALIATLDQSSDSEFVYDPGGKREPFRPFEVSLNQGMDCAKEPLTCFDVGQLRLAAVMTGLDVPRASIEDATGKGYLVGIGAKVGRNGGEVAEILPDKIKILETSTDIVTGQAKNKVVEMELRTKDVNAGKSVLRTR